jgi:hypothetical protein
MILVIGSAPSPTLFRLSLTTFGRSLAEMPSKQGAPDSNRNSDQEQHDDFHRFSFDYADC